MLSRLRTVISADALIAATIFVGTLTALLATSRDIAMAFDEGFTVDREITLAEWFDGLWHPAPGWTRSDYFRPEVLEECWRFSRKEPDGHPPFYALLGLAGWWASRGWADPLTSYRFGPMVLTAATAGAIGFFLSRRYGRIAGITGSLALVLSPRMFTHAHYAHYDMPVTCLWLLAQMAFVKSVHAARWAPAFGFGLGLAAATKFTGWFALAPALGWWAIFEGLPLLRRGLRGIRLHGGPRSDRPAPPLPPGLPATRALLIGVPLAAMVLYAVQPAWWAHPWRGVSRFLVSNLTREQSVPVTSLYLGTVYRFALPWHNTIVLTAVTTPVSIVVLGLLGLAVALARGRSDRDGLIWPLSWSVLMIVRALPDAPGHDVERLLLPSLASLAVLAGIGAGWLAGRARTGWMTRFALLLPVLPAGECLAGLVPTYPYQLSYYSAAVGGLPGAERMGFEETYYWDTLGPEFLGWVEAESHRRPTALAFPIGLVNIMILRDWGVFPRKVKVAGLDRGVASPDYVLQRNRGIYAPCDWWLERHGHPRFVIRRQGVDLLRVYPAAEFEQAVESTRGQPGVLRSSERPTWGLGGGKD